MELTQIETFIEIVEQGSFRKAAKSLFITQPSVSGRIQILEEELGSPLFHRLGRGVRLTKEGKSFFDYAQRSIDALVDGKAAFQRSLRNQAETLHLATARGIGTYILPGLLRDFRASSPDITPHISVGRSTEVLNMVLRDEVQLGLCRSLKHPDIDSIYLYDEEIVLVTNPSHPFAQRDGVSILEVSREPLILYDPGSIYFLMINQVCREAGIKPRVEMSLDSIEATKQMIEIGMGISFLPRNGIRYELERKSLSVVTLIGTHRVTLPTSIILRRSEHYPNTVSSFLKLLENVYNKKILFGKANP